MSATICATDPQAGARAEERKSLVRVAGINAACWAVFLPGSVGAWTNDARAYPVAICAFAWALGVFAQTRQVINSPARSTRSRRWIATVMTLGGLAPMWAVLVLPLLSR